jgi:uncharacterized protein (TIGR03083 family)
MKRPAEIVVVERFAPLRTQLLALLAGLAEDDWARPTAAPRWSVKDVTAHLLGGDIGILSRGRDFFSPPSRKVGTYSELVDLVNRLNEEWVVAARRMSPRLLRELLALIGSEVEAYFSSLDLKAIGGPVSWAGPDPAPMWFDIAREFTERWHHQQQIRDATGQPPLYDPYFLSPSWIRLCEPYLTVSATPLPQKERWSDWRFQVTLAVAGFWLGLRTHGNLRSNPKLSPRWM